MVYDESNLNDDEGLELWCWKWATARERERDDVNIQEGALETHTMMGRAASWVCF